MPDINLNDATPSHGGPGGPIFIPISLTADTTTITSGTPVNFSFAMNSVPSNPTYTIGFYTTRNQPGASETATPVNSGGKPVPVALSMTPLTMPAPTITPTSQGGTFSATFSSSALPAPPDSVIVTVTIASQASLGLCCLSYD